MGVIGVGETGLVRGELFVMSGAIWPEVRQLECPGELDLLGTSKRWLGKVRRQRVFSLDKFEKAEKKSIPAPHSNTRALKPMLSIVFDAVAAGLPEPIMTPLIAIPTHQPPNVERSQMVSQRHGKGSIRRNFASDTWLYNTITNADLGRIISNDAIDENRSKITTERGVFIIDPTMRVLRGKHGKQSIFGHVLSIHSFMD